MGSGYSSNRLGQYAILKVEQRALEKGIIVSKPTIECRYDLILDDGERLCRAQVKYSNRKHGRQAEGVVPVGLRKWRKQGTNRILLYKACEIDLVLVYVRKIDKILCFGPDVFDGRQELQIRIVPAKNNQRIGCLMATDYVW
jgi:hypothetical protein